MDIISCCFFWPLFVFIIIALTNYLCVKVYKLPFGPKIFPFVTKHFLEKFNISCERLSFLNYKFYNSQKKIYVIILEKFNNHAYTILIYSPKKVLFSQQKLRNFIQSFNFKLEKNTSNQNGTLLMFLRTKKSPYISWGGDPYNHKTRYQQKLFYDLIKDLKASTD